MPDYWNCVSGLHPGSRDMAFAGGGHGFCCDFALSARIEFIALYGWDFPSSDWWSRTFSADDVAARQPGAYGWVYAAYHRVCPAPRTQSERNYNVIPPLSIRCIESGRYRRK